MELTKAKATEVEGVNLAEKGKFPEALTMFNLVVESAPTYPSGFNNRAQCLRLMGDIHGRFTSFITSLIVQFNKSHACFIEIVLPRRYMYVYTALCTTCMYVYTALCTTYMYVYTALCTSYMYMCALCILRF